MFARKYMFFFKKNTILGVMLWLCCKNVYIWGFYDTRQIFCIIFLHALGKLLLGRCKFDGIKMILNLMLKLAANITSR